MTVLSLDAVGKRYGATRALHDVSLNFAEGRITAVIGRSGCGKSTLLKLCNGLVAPDAGSVRVFGKSMNYSDLPPLRRRMGYAVQGTGLFPHLTARGNITSLAQWQRGRIEQRLAEHLVIMDEGRVRCSAGKAALLEANPAVEPDALLQLLMGEVGA